MRQPQWPRVVINVCMEGPGCARCQNWSSARAGTVSGHLKIAWPVISVVTVTSAFFEHTEWLCKTYRGRFGNFGRQSRTHLVVWEPA
eukprot:6206592-Pleurochrysis_carterae.AAC.7